MKIQKFIVPSIIIILGTFFFIRSLFWFLKSFNAYTDDIAFDIITGIILLVICFLFITKNLGEIIFAVCSICRILGKCDNYRIIWLVFPSDIFRRFPAIII